MFVAVSVIDPGWPPSVAWASSSEPESTVIWGVLKPMFRNGLLASGLATVTLSAPELPCETPVR